MDQNLYMETSSREFLKGFKEGMITCFILLDNAKNGNEFTEQLISYIIFINEQIKKRG